jgi:protein-S-isoprenylcysteine O-methyltransferase Ste14
MTGATTELILLVAAWSGYFALHSALASLRVKRWVAARRPGLMPAYRLTYVGLAVLLLGVPVAVALRQAGAPLWEWQGPWRWAADALAALAALGFLWTLRHYDLGEFLGLRQLRAGTQTVEDQEHLKLTLAHRFVRHPWYFLGLVALWTRPMDPAGLVSALCISGYLVLGSRLEEHKLIAYHGEVYRRYRRSVPALFPLPWRHLTAQAAADLQADVRGTPGTSPS